MRSAILMFALGVWLLQQQAVLPDLRWLWLAAPLLLFALLPRRVVWQRFTRTLLLGTLAAACGFFYAAWMAQHRLGDELPAAWQGKDIEVTGVVAGMPKRHERGLSFAFDAEQVQTAGVHVPRRRLLSTYENAKDEPLRLHAGERWQFTVRLKQPHGTSNPYNFDFEAWALENNVRATGYVHGKADNRRIDPLVERPFYLIEHVRESVRERFQRVLALSRAVAHPSPVYGREAGGEGAENQYAGVLIALAIGDQSSIPQAQWQVFTRTGVNHLMSI